MIVLVAMLFPLVSQCGGSFLLTLSPLKSGENFQHPVSLECDFWGSEVTSTIQHVTEIVILKDDVTQGYIPVARVNNDSSNVISDQMSPSVSVSGNTSSLLGSFLRLAWPLVTSEVFDGYVCEVHGLDHQKNVFTERSPEYRAADSNMSIHDLLEIIKVERQEERNYFQSKLNHVNLTLLDSVVKELEVNKLQIDKLTRDMDNVRHHPLLQLWPEGSYALLMPDTGCPLDGLVSWLTGYRMLHTESEGVSHNNVSQNSHLFKPYKYFFFLQFCTLTNSPGVAWPNGSYCVHRKGGTCPQGFYNGSVYLDEEDTGTVTHTEGQLPDVVLRSGDTELYFCCRSDGPASRPIDLPNFKPFYLYRYAGTCQEVTGTEVTEIEMTIDTEDFSNDDKYSNEYHPDGQLNNTIFKLCYYTRVNPVIL